VEVTRAIILPTTVEDAWATLTDWDRQADWMLDADRVTVVSREREGVGVRLEVQTRVLGLIAFTEPIDVVRWDPPHGLSIRHGGPVRGLGVWRLDRTDGGTRFVWVERVSLRVPVIGELAARAYAPTMRWLMGRAMRSLRSSIIARGPAR
jgi:Polyketide cyclase / dehydrase and lipid transport